MSAATPPTRVIEISANLDDRSGEEIAAAISALLEAGALDAWAQPIVMKKGRPGFTLSLLAAETDQARLSRKLLAETGAFGCRFCAKDRLVLERAFEAVETKFGNLRVKVGKLNGRVVAWKPEFDEADAAAKKCGVPVRRVLEAAKVAWALAHGPAESGV